MGGFQKDCGLPDARIKREKSYDRINKDLRDAYESYKLGMTDRENYLE